MIVFACLVNKPELYTELRDSLQLDSNSRIVSVLNAESMPKGYNALAATAKPDDILVFLHQDTRLLFDWKRKIPQYFNALPKAGVVGVVGLHKIRSLSWGCWSHGGVLEGREMRPINFRACAAQVGDDLKWTEVEALDCVCLMVKKSVFDKMGGFDDYLPGWNFHDIDFSMKALKAGFKNYCIGERVQHYGGTLIQRGCKPEERYAWQDRWEDWLVEHKRVCRDTVVYTAIVGKYDRLIQHKHISPFCDYVCFSDQPLVKTGNWQIRPLCNPPTDNVRAARWHKIMAAALFPQYRASVWVDAIVNISSNVLDKRIVELNRSSVAMAANVHNLRKCLYAEAYACKMIKKDSPAIIQKQMDFYKSIKLPANLGLFETNVLYRKHRIPLVKTVMDNWWNIIVEYSRRDQLSFTYVLHKHGAVCEKLFEKSMRSMPWFSLAAHL